MRTKDFIGEELLESSDSLFLLFLMILLILNSACNSARENSESEQLESVVAPTEIQIETKVSSVLPTATGPITVTFQPLPTITNDPTMTPSPTCPEPGTATPFIYPVDTNELQTSILTFLNTGGQWNDLLAVLDGLKISYDLVQADMDGNGVMETVVYARVNNESDTPDHAWWIFQCASNQYKVIYDVRGTWAFHSQFIAEDLNNDSNPEVIAISGFAGSACALEPKVWSWEVDEIVDLSPNYHELELGCSINQRALLHDVNDDYVKELILIGETVGHLSFAPQRGITQTFTLEDTGYKLVDTVFTLANIRVHVLDDAQRALDAGEFSDALTHYTKAAYENMTTIGSYHILNMEQYPDAYQRAFALFRLAVIQRAIGNREEANFILTDLQELYLENQPGYEFGMLTQTFFDAFEETENLEEACAEVTNFIVDHYEIDTEPDSPKLTSHFYWGANIASYTTPDSFCPVFDVKVEDSSSRF